MWTVMVVSGGPEAMSMELNGLVAKGWTIRLITSHGLGSWTVFAFKEDESAIITQGRPSFWKRLNYAFSPNG